jgi:hypothetical protein
MKQITRAIAFLAAISASFYGCAGQKAALVNDPGNILLSFSKTALCLPVDTLHVRYVDNTKAMPDTLFNDSFFMEAANGLLLFEVSKNFSIRQWTPQDASVGAPTDADSLAVFRHGGFSRLLKDTGSIKAVSNHVADLAKKYNTDLVVVPYTCLIRNFAVRPAGWRNDKYGTSPGYERPISYTSKTEFHVQIWDKSGTLLYEKIGKSDAGRPVFYSLLKKEKHPDKDIVKYAKRIYAPPLVKSLYNSIKAAVRVRT